ncbi:MAG: hypothetical protein ACRDBG_14240 [Waterburya sp.]
MSNKEKLIAALKAEHERLKSALSDDMVRDFNAAIKYLEDGTKPSNEDYGDLCQGCIEDYDQMLLDYDIVFIPTTII